MKPKMAFLDFEDDGELEGEDGAFKDSIIEPVYRQKSDKPNANSSQGRAPTLTIEVIRVSRPLKVSSMFNKIGIFAII